MRRFVYVEPWVNSSDGTIEHTEVEMTEEEILDHFFEYWTTRMKMVGKDNEINEENCIIDWCVMNWAVEVTE